MASVNKVIVSAIWAEIPKCATAPMAQQSALFLWRLRQAGKTRLPEISEKKPNGIGLFSITDWQKSSENTCARVVRSMWKGG